ncbi:MAG: shikimate dehydrogenase family protein [Actinomycetota bacterium]
MADDPAGLDGASGPGAATPRIHGSSHTVGVIGWPVEHSLSPAIHNAAFAALGLDWVYVPLPVPPGAVGDALAGLRALGFAGANVTMPHKSEVALRIDDLSDDARRLAAVNTIQVADDAVSGHNTDAPGFDRFLRLDAGFDPAGRSALVFGAGGAARACALSLARADLATLTIAARDPAAVDGVRAALDGFATAVRGVAIGEAAGEPADLLVNATPLGAQGEELPLPALSAETLAIDLLYLPAVTPFQAAARAGGAVAFGGLGLLLHQAALSLELWTGRPPPREVMSAAALADLAEHP